MKSGLLAGLTWAPAAHSHDWIWPIDPGWIGRFAAPQCPLERLRNHANGK